MLYIYDLYYIFHHINKKVLSLVFLEVRQLIGFLKGRDGVLVFKVEVGFVMVEGTILGCVVLARKRKWNMVKEMKNV